jgi:iron(III) transport system ATP-binding protein|tara:strand:+ start:42 stop:1097 length:1056 start_codon:yes stop_codon:yes gene_type:complete
METAVEFKHVTKAYGDVRAVSGLSFTIERGKLVTLLGPSGCGKTTTLRLIAGLEMVTEGSIFIGGREVTRLSASDRDVSMVFQSYALFPHMTVIQNVSYGLTMSKMSKAEVSEKAAEGLNLVGLTGYGGRLPSELSGGQQQRVAVARALVLEPEVLLFDEPLSNLDAKLRRRVREEIRELQQKLSLTTIYVTHDQEEALAVSDRIIVMNEAVIAQEGTPHQLYEEPANLFVSDFIGDANLVKAEILRIDGDEAEVNIGGIQLKLPHRGIPAGEVDVGIRPQAISLNTAVNKDEISATIIKASYLGDHIEYTLESALGELFVIDNQMEKQFDSGSTVSLTFRTRGLSLIPES